MNAIADASSLIVLARLHALWLLERMFGVVALVPEVETEAVVQGKAKGYADATQIEAAITAGQLVVISPTPAEVQWATALGQSAAGLSRADCMTLACARERSLMLIIEDRRGRNVAVAHGLDYVVIQVLPLYGFIRGQLSFAECTDLLTRIGRAMHTEQAILAALQAAADEIHRLRTTQGGRTA